MNAISNATFGTWPTGTIIRRSMIGRAGSHLPPRSLRAKPPRASGPPPGGNHRLSATDLVGQAFSLRTRFSGSSRLQRRPPLFSVESLLIKQVDVNLTVDVPARDG